MRWFLDAGVPTSQIKPDVVFISHSRTSPFLFSLWAVAHSFGRTLLLFYSCSLANGFMSVAVIALLTCPALPARWFRHRPLDDAAPSRRPAEASPSAHHLHSVRGVIVVRLTGPSAFVYQVYAPAEAVPFLAGYVAGMNKLNQQSDDYEDRYR
jgi:hypothetical protein